MSLINRPRIGVTGPDIGGGVAWFFTAVAVLRAGGWPVRISPSREKSISHLHGLIIGGGADIDPTTYEKQDFLDQYFTETEKNKSNPFWRRIAVSIRLTIYSIIFRLRKAFSKPRHSIDKSRDRIEFYLVNKAVQMNMPLLGICRGSQLINIYFRGDLYQEIVELYSEKVNKHSIFPIKKIFIKPGSKLEAIIGRDQIYVNALHHQAVKDPGKGIQIVAKEENGLTQAIESTEHDFILGVQWHPEYLVEKKVQQRIFKTLVEKASLVKAKNKEIHVQHAQAT